MSQNIVIRVDSEEGFDMADHARYEAAERERCYAEAVADGFFEHDDDEADFGFEDDGQPSEYDEWQDYMGGDDSDHGQYEDMGDYGYSDEG
jgi:hypothetical protein